MCQNRLGVAPSEATCWTVIRGAAAGRGEARAEFARRYGSVIRAYLGARWKDLPLVHEIDDATQDVFLDCFRENGALARADDSRPFGAFLYGVVRNVARRVERESARNGLQLHSGFDLETREKSLSGAFDRAWARSIMKQAAALQRSKAAGDERAAVRVELLRLRFQEDLPIREIATRLGEDPAKLHREYAVARAEFRAALREVVAEHHPHTPGDVERECQRLIRCFR